MDSRVSILFSVASLLGAACSSQPLQSTATQGGAGATSTASGGTSAVAGEGLPALARAPYPAGPYGRGVGATIENLSFLGWRDPVAAGYDTNKLEVISLSDFYNPGGTTNDVKLIVLNAAAVWCVVCRAEYSYLSSANVYASYRPKGVEVLGVIFQDNNYNPSQPSDLVLWGKGFSVPFPLVLDPGFKVGTYFGSDATPMNMIIEASSMRIVDVTMGYDTSQPSSYWSGVDGLLRQIR